MSDAQAKDTGMALVLICLLIYLFGHFTWALWAAVALLVIDMTWVGFFRPVAVLWFGLATLLGTVMSKVVLTLIFLIVVTPIALLRRLGGADAMKIKRYRRDRDSVFTNRDHRYESKDMDTIY